MNNNNKRPLINLIPYLFVSLFLIMMAFSNPVKTNNTNLNYREFNELVETQKIASAKVSIDYNTMTITGVYKEGDGSSHPFTAIIPNTEKAADELIDELKKVDNVTFVDANASNYLLELISSIVPLVLFAIAGLFIMNRMGAMNSNKQAFDFSKKPYVMMIVGVNGVGKTTTIGKLAASLRAQGKKVVKLIRRQFIKRFHTQFHRHPSRFYSLSVTALHLSSAWKGYAFPHFMVVPLPSHPV